MNGGNMSDPPYIDTDGQVAWIAEHADLPYEVVAQVLALEFDYMVAVGIAQAPGYEFSFYSPDDLAGEKSVDTLRLAQDAERFLGVPADVADKVFETEVEFLQMRGLA
jgi:hypothetical protein